MKKISAVVLAIALVLMASVPFCASAEAAVPEITVDGLEVPVGSEEVTLTFNYKTVENLLNGAVELTWEEGVLSDAAASVKIEVGEEGSKMGVKDPDDPLISGCVFAAVDPIIPASGTLMTVTFKINGSPEVGTEIPVSMLIKTWVGNGEVDLLEGQQPTETLTIKIVEKPTEPSQDAPTQAPTEAPTQAPTEAPTTTAAASATGEATPYALMATVAVAGAALVVLCTKKRK